MHRFQHGNGGQLIKLEVEPYVGRAGGNIGIGGHMEHGVEVHVAK